MSLDDTVNQLYAGTQMCGAQSHSILENGVIPAYLSVSGDQVTIQTADTTLTGLHTLTITTSLVQYPLITDTASVSLTLFQLVDTEPVIAPILYNVNDPLIQITYSPFVVSPASSVISI
jgi:hypothetical protein